MRNEPFHPHAASIEKVGKTLAVAALLGIIPQYVSKYKRRGLPKKMIPLLVKRAKAIGVELDEEQLRAEKAAN